MPSTLASSLRSIRVLMKVLPTFTREQVDDLIQLELKGARRRSVGMRLAQRAARLDADATFLKVIKEFNDDT